MNRSLSGKKLPQFYELFPNTEISKQIIEQQRKLEIEAYKAQWVAYMANHNKKQKGGK